MPAIPPLERSASEQAGRGALRSEGAGGGSAGAAAGHAVYRPRAKKRKQPPASALTQEERSVARGQPPSLRQKMAEKLAPPGELFLRKGRESVSSLDLDRLTPGEAAGEESSDSEGEQDGSSHKLIRKVSTSGQMRTKGMHWCSTLGRVLHAGEAGVLFYPGVLFYQLRNWCSLEAQFGQTDLNISMCGWEHSLLQTDK
ncbi:UNVERIFIED_CONTAM: hypothetical protein K2H54_031571 [Gekko kuhli]